MKGTSIAAIALALLLGVGDAGAATSGSYRCVAFQGSPEDITATVPIFIHYNPNSRPQSIRQIKIWDPDGGLLDSGLIPAGHPDFLVPPFTSYPIFVTGEITGGYQISVKWSQTVDGKAPITKVNSFHFDETLTFVSSVSQADCP